MHSMTSAFAPDAAGNTPKQTGSIPNLKLNDGHEIPMLAYGLGTARYKKGGMKELDEHTITCVKTAIKSGYYHLDGAEDYGNEEELGKAIKESGVSREKLFVTTKMTAETGRLVEEAFSASLRKLGLDYVDLYLIHSPFWTDSEEEWQDKWRQMEAIKESGRARSIGVSNYLLRHLEATLRTARIPPAINQIEFHPYLQHGDLVDFHRRHGIALSAYAPLTAVTKAAPGPLDGTYRGLAEKYGVTEGEVALRWVIDLGIVVITTSSRGDRLQGIISKLPSFKLTPKEVDEISELGRQKHFRGFWAKHFAADDRS